MDCLNQNVVTEGLVQVEFKIGDKVKCIMDYQEWDGTILLKAGNIYEVFQFQDYTGPEWNSIRNEIGRLIIVNHHSVKHHLELVPKLSGVEKAKLIREVNKSSEDPVNLPSHYRQGKIEVLDFIEDQKLDFHEAQVLKYVVRARHKGNELQDLQKALFYLNRKIAILEGKNNE